MQHCQMLSDLKEKNKLELRGIEWSGEVERIQTSFMRLYFSIIHTHFVSKFYLIDL